MDAEATKSRGNPENIAFFSGELIDDQHVLLRIIQEQLSQVRINL